MPEWVVVVILGIIEGVTEFLPISSTGHLLIAEHWLPRQSDLFNTVIQCGAVLAVILVFAGRLRELLSNWREKETRDYLLKLGVAFVVTAACGLVVKKLGMRLPKDILPVALATLIGGILFIVVESWLRGRAFSDEVSWGTAIAVGLAQIAAGIFPGLSRSGATILVALVMGVGRAKATEFSFLVGIPTLLAAGGKEIYDAVKHHDTQPEWSMVLLGTALATLTAFMSVRWLLQFIRTHMFVAFGWYRIVVGVALLVLILR